MSNNNVIVKNQPKKTDQAILDEMVLKYQLTLDTPWTQEMYDFYLSAIASDTTLLNNIQMLSKFKIRLEVEKRPLFNAWPAQKKVLTMSLKDIDSYDIIFEKPEIFFNNENFDVHYLEHMATLPPFTKDTNVYEYIKQYWWPVFDKKNFKKQANELYDIYSMLQFKCLPPEERIISDERKKELLNAMSQSIDLHRNDIANPEQQMRRMMKGLPLAEQIFVKNYTECKSFFDILVRDPQKITLRNIHNPIISIPATPKLELISAIVDLIHEDKFFSFQLPVSFSKTHPQINIIKERYNFVKSLNVNASPKELLVDTFNALKCEILDINEEITMEFALL